MAAQRQKPNLGRLAASLPLEEKFFALALFVLDGFLGGLAWRASGSQQIFLVLAFVSVLLVIVLLVWWMRVDQNRRVHDQHMAESMIESEKFAEALADDICEAFEGALENCKEITEKERELPYELLCSAVPDREALSDAEKHFAQVLVRKVQRSKARTKR